MRALVYTVLINDMKLFRVWYNYYSKYFDAIHVLCYGTKKEYQKQLKKLKNTTIEYVADEVNRPEDIIHFLKEKQITFFEKYDWVLYCNLDEFLITKPSKFKDLRDLMKTYKKDYIHAIAYDIVKTPCELPIDYSRPILAQRKNWVKNTDYNKIILSRVPLNWNAGTHQIDSISGEESKCFKNKGLYLVHLKQIDHERQDDDLGPHYAIKPEEYRGDKAELIPNFIKVI